MTFQQLAYLLEVSRTGSISGAAKNLFLAQSSVSAAISNLEEELGITVFIRTKKGVIPTAQGAAVIEQAARIRESYLTMTRHEAREKKHIRISAPATEELDEAFAQLIACMKENDKVSFSLNRFSTVEAAGKLASFELDVALLLNHKARFLSVETLLRSKELAWETIAEFPAVIQIGPGHPLYEKERIEIGDLEGFLFVDHMDDPLVHNVFLKGVIPLSPDRTVAVKSDYAAHLLVAKGLCFSMGAGAPGKVSETFGFRSIPLPDVSYTLTAVTNPKRELDGETKTYLRLVKGKFGRENLRFPPKQMERV